MTDIATLAGAIDNGWRGVAAFPFYTGPVGIRDRGPYREVAFFAPPLRLKALPVRGTLDGVPVLVTAIRARDLNGETAGKISATAPRAIVAIVEPVSLQEID